MTDLVADVAVAVEVKCQRTERALVKWRMETHAKLTTAYKARLAEYEEKLAALEVQAGVAIRGRNPALNLELMSDELKKHCITHPDRAAFRPVRCDPAGRGPTAADRSLRERGRGPVRPLLRAGVRVGADDLAHLSVLLGPQEPVGRADRV